MATRSRLTVDPAIQGVFINKQICNKMAQMHSYQLLNYIAAAKLPQKLNLRN